MAAARGQFKRSVIFIAFSGEELGLLGSAAYTRNPPLPLASTVAMLNMDMVRRLRNNALFIGGMDQPGLEAARRKAQRRRQPQTGNG